MIPTQVIYVVANFQDFGGPSFICTDKGTAKAFPTATHAWEHIENHHLDPRIWTVAVITEIHI